MWICSSHKSPASSSSAPLSPSSGPALLLIVIYSLLQTVWSVTVTQVAIVSSSGRSEYVVQGEDVQISCHYILTRINERINSVSWQKDGEAVYFSVPRKRPIAVGLLTSHIKLNALSSDKLLNTIEIQNVTMEMHGLYTCLVTSDDGSESKNEAFMTVIVDACKESDWKTHTNMIKCEEEIDFKCSGMFPRPSPICSLYNEITGQYIAAESFDRNDLSQDGTYQVAIRRHYKAKDWLHHSGHLSFRCYAVVLMTSWRTGITHRLFGDPGCRSQPPSLTNGHYNIVGELTCWQTPRELSTAHYWCEDGFDFGGPQVFICRNGNWTHSIEAKDYVIPTKVRVDRRAALTNTPYCVPINCQRRVDLAVSILMVQILVVIMLIR